jgi:hypothetical protein
MVSTKQNKALSKFTRHRSYSRSQSTLAKKKRHRPLRIPDPLHLKMMRVIKS